MASRLKLIAVIYCWWLGFFLLARGGFLVYHWGDTSRLSLGAIAGIFAAGLRLDLSSAAYLSAMPAILLAVSVFRLPLEPARAALWLWLVLAIVIMALIVTADLELARQWGRRIDAAFVPYLATPREAWASTGGTPRRLLLGIAIVTIAVSLAIGHRLVLRPLNRLGPSRWWAFFPCAAVLAPLVIASRGGIQRWPLTVSSAYHSDVPFENLAAQNAPWGFFDSLYRGLYDRSNPFRVLADSAAAAAIRQARQPAGPRQRPPLSIARPNVLIIIWESASARAIASLGGVAGVTPRFDSLARTGILFRRFYAAADRTDKGIGAVLSSSPAVPRGSVLLVPSKAASLPFLSADLERGGYATSFYYGGELEFGSLKAYLVHAGFDRVVGKDDFPTSNRSSPWGAHDEVVAERLVTDLDGIAEPFFAVWLTLSSHEPFDTPDPPASGDADWQDQFFSSMRYSDRVIGELTATASRKPWWPRTLVVIVADHGRRVLPLDAEAEYQSAEARHRIPMLWLGGALTVRDSLVDQVASQVDLAPTLLDALDLEFGPRYRFGRSLLRPIRAPFAYYGFDEGFGVVTDRGALVYDQRGRRITSRVGQIGESERTLGAALLQTTYQDYLDR